jgi:hypothetical protein
MALLPFTSTAILLLLCIPFVCALPPFNRTSAPTLDVTDSPSSSCNRTLWDIIWSCAATIFACTWTIVHPNIPGMYEGRIAVCSHRLFIMVLALIAPELMITWAILQFLSAREATKAFNDAFGAQARSDHPESTVELLSGFAPSDGRTSPHPSTAYISGRDFGGWSPGWHFGAVTNFVRRMSHRMDSNTRFFCMDGWIHALHQWQATSYSHT